MTGQAGHAWRAWSRAACAAGVLVGLYFVVPLPARGAQGHLLAGVGALVLGLPAVTLLVALQVRRALHRDSLPGDQIALLLTLVIAVVTFFAGGYFVLADQFAGLHTRLDALYFSVATLTTVGYGDITPTGQLARAVTTIQMIFDLIIVTSAISIIISAARRRPGPAPTSADETAPADPT